MDMRPFERRIIDLRHPVEEAARTMHERNTFLEWDAHEYHHYPKSQRWFAGMGVVTAVFALFGFLTGNIFFALFVLVAAFVIYLFAIREPRIVSNALTAQGVRAGNRLFDYEDLESFWIFYEIGGIKELSIETKRGLISHVRMPLGEAEPVAVREILIQFVPEKRHEESLANILSRLVGF